MAPYCPISSSRSFCFRYDGPGRVHSQEAVEDLYSQLSLSPVVAEIEPKICSSLEVSFNPKPTIMSGPHVKEPTSQRITTSRSGFLRWARRLVEVRHSSALVCLSNIQFETAPLEVICLQLNCRLHLIGYTIRELWIRRIAPDCHLIVATCTSGAGAEDVHSR